jgi:two-component system, chemotaxis family, protein-glutamate methylesterase/glutaminase
MARIRILVVDDSVVIRKLLCDTLASDPEIEVVGTAGNGSIALSRIAQVNPDVVTLDVEMPVMGGLETLRELRKSHSHLPIIMFSTLTERGAAATLEALSLGASDYVTKPTNTGSLSAGVETIRTELIPKIKALSLRSSSRLKHLPRPKPTVRVAPQLQQPINIVAIGTSTGGPNALAEVLPRIPKNLPVPIVVVQHMPPIFTRFLAERLATLSEILVAEGRDGTTLLPGQAWIAPGDFHMTVMRAGLQSRLELNQASPEHSCRPAVDVLFRSVAKAYGSHVLAVVMTGMGADGVLGAQHVREAGGQVIIQDEASSVVWGMPGLVYAAGHADGVYPLDRIADEITRRVFQSREQSSIPASARAAHAGVRTS